jgi:hypothetical protein
MQKYEYHKPVWFMAFFSARADMTPLSAERDWLILIDSLRLSPCTPVLAKRSIPAKSTSQSLLHVHSRFIRFSALTVMHSILKRRYIRRDNKQVIHKGKKILCITRIVTNQ